jgi:hypothetical protein
VADGWCWFVLREEYYWLIAGGWFVLREKYCWLVADKPSEQADYNKKKRSSTQAQVSSVLPHKYNIYIYIDTHTMIQLLHY